MKSASQQSSEVRKAGSLAFAGIVFYCAHILQQAQARDASIQDDQVHNESQDDLDVVTSQQVPMDSVDQLASNVMGDASITNIELSTINVRDHTEMSDKDAVMAEEEDNDGSGMWLLLGGAAIVGGAIAAGNSGGGGSSTTVTTDGEPIDIYLQDNYQTMTSSSMSYGETDMFATDSGVAVVRAGQGVPTTRDGELQNIIQVQHKDLDDSSLSTEEYVLAEGSLNEIGLTVGAKQQLSDFYSNAKNFVAFAMSDSNNQIAPIDVAGNHVALLVIYYDGSHDYVGIKLSDALITAQLQAGDDDIVKIDALSTSIFNGVETLGLNFSVSNYTDEGMTVDQLAWTLLERSDEEHWQTPQISLTGNPVSDAVNLLSTISFIDLGQEVPDKTAVLSDDATVITLVSQTVDGEGNTNNNYSIAKMDNLMNTELEDWYQRSVEEDPYLSVQPYEFSDVLPGGILTAYDYLGGNYYTMVSEDGSEDDIVTSSGSPTYDYETFDPDGDYWADALFGIGENGMQLFLMLPEVSEDGPQYLSASGDDFSLMTLFPGGTGPIDFSSETGAEISLFDWATEDFTLEDYENNPAQVLDKLSQAKVTMAWDDLGSGDIYTGKFHIDQLVAQEALGAMKNINQSEDPIVYRYTTKEGTAFIDITGNGVQASVLANGLVANGGPIQSQVSFDGGLMTHAAGPNGVYVIVEEGGVLSLNQYNTGDDNKLALARTLQLTEEDDADVTYSAGKDSLLPALEIYLLDADGCLAVMNEGKLCVYEQTSESWSKVEDIEWSSGMQIMTQNNGTDEYLTAVVDVDGNFYTFNHEDGTPFMAQLSNGAVDLGDLSIETLTGISPDLSIVFAGERDTDNLVAIDPGTGESASVKDGDGVNISGIENVQVAFNTGSDDPGLGVYDYLVASSDGSLVTLSDGVQTSIELDGGDSVSFNPIISSEGDLLGVSMLASLQTVDGQSQFSRETTLQDFYESSYALGDILTLLSTDPSMEALNDSESGLDDALYTAFDNLGLDPVGLYSTAGIDGTYELPESSDGEANDFSEALQSVLDDAI